MYKLQKNLGMYLSSLILIIFTIIFLIKGNFEFITYTISIGFLIFIIIKTDKKFNYPQIAKFGFAIWLLLHFLGGSLKINGIRLYDTILIPIFSEPLNIFRYDQLLHTFCYFVFVFFVYSVVKNSLKENISKGMTLFIIVLIAEGIGAINEIIELSTVVFFHTQGVGNYYNNALDLVFNLIGAMLGSIIILNTNKE
ncbi:MAG TPA: DUF2238 domain-containing protein [bacterium]|nr:DUF2238 domain-containing protein [bacterium]